MSELLEAIQQRHQEALDHLQRDEVGEDFLESVQVLLDDLRQAGALVPDPAERGQLRAWMRFWGNVIYDHTGVYPDTTLQPLDLDRAPPAAGSVPRDRNVPFGWLLAGSAASILLLIAVLSLLLLGRDGETALSTPMPTRRPLPMSELIIGEAPMDAGEALKARDIFCYGVREIVIDLDLEEASPETLWRWEVRRGSEVVNAQPEQRWGGGVDTPLTVLSGDAGIEPGRYEFRLYVDDQRVETRAFRVLEAPPQVTNLRVADVPEPQENDSGGQLGAGTRVIYLNYQYEGLCPGLEIAHRLYRQEDLLQETVKTWAGPTQGAQQVTFQSLGDKPFSSDHYSAVVKLEEQEQPRKASFIVGEREPEIPPAFGDVTVALGVNLDGSPILPAEETTFDWNTKVVYAIFEYVGMRDDLSWSAVWTRNGQEIARQGGFWDIEAFGAEGTRWVVYYDAEGQTLPGGDYTVTLFIEDEARRRREFNIRYYVASQ
jgi:hypothetical protein